MTSLEMSQTLTAMRNMAAAMRDEDIVDPGLSKAPADTLFAWLGGRDSPPFAQPWTMAANSGNGQNGFSLPYAAGSSQGPPSGPMNSEKGEGRIAHGAEEEPPLPLPQASGVLAALGGADITALELGMKQFLDDVGHHMARNQGTIGLYLWTLAGAATLAACEVARRQWKRSDAAIAEIGTCDRFFLE